MRVSEAVKFVKLDSDGSSRVCYAVTVQSPKRALNSYNTYGKAWAQYEKGNTGYHSHAPDPGDRRRDHGENAV